MNIQTDQMFTIFKNDYNGYSYYKVGVSRKKQDGSYMNGYIRCQFRKGVTLENKTRIYIRKAWLSFSLKEKETIPFIFINEFEIVDETIKKSKEKEVLDHLEENTARLAKEEEQEQQYNDPFQSFGEEVVINPDDLPF